MSKYCAEGHSDAEALQFPTWTTKGDLFSLFVVMSKTPRIMDPRAVRRACENEA